jgi:hypothetical protein
MKLVSRQAATPSAAGRWQTATSKDIRAWREEGRDTPTALASSRQPFPTTRRIWLYLGDARRRFAAGNENAAGNPAACKGVIKLVSGIATAAD